MYCYVILLWIEWEFVASEQVLKEMLKFCLESQPTLSVSSHMTHNFFSPLLAKFDYYLKLLFKFLKNGQNTKWGFDFFSLLLIYFDISITKNTAVFLFRILSSHACLHK